MWNIYKSMFTSLKKNIIDSWGFLLNSDIEYIEHIKTQKFPYLSGSEIIQIKFEGN